MTNVPVGVPIDTIPVGVPIDGSHAVAVLYGPPASGKSRWLQRDVRFVEVHGHRCVGEALLRGTIPTQYLVYTCTTASADEAYAEACTVFRDVIADERTTELSVNCLRKDFPVESEPILEMSRPLARVGRDPVVWRSNVERARRLRRAQ